MTLQSSGSITASQIANELGYTLGSSTRIGDYRLNGGQDFGGVKLPVSENIPTSGAIKFSDFYGGRRTLVVDYYSGSAENKPQSARQRFINRSKVVVGNFVGSTNNTTGKKVVILVNKDIGSNKNAPTSCALRTGNWSIDTILEVLVGPNGEVLGAGGNGGSGRNGNTGLGGGSGTSGLGIQYEGTGGTKVTIQSGGLIAGGGGGGGGGGGARVTREIWWGSGDTRTAAGGRGGGGAGLPSGDPNGSKYSGGPGAGGGASGNNPGARGGTGGNGSVLGGSGGNGSNGFTNGGEQENPAGYGGGGGGAPGAAIRRNSGYTVIIQNLGPPNQLVGSTSATGIT